MQSTPASLFHCKIALHFSPYLISAPLDFPLPYSLPTLMPPCPDASLPSCPSLHQSPYLEVTSSEHAWYGGSDGVVLDQHVPRLVQLHLRGERSGINHGGGEEVRKDKGGHYRGVIPERVPASAPSLHASQLSTGMSAQPTVHRWHAGTSISHTTTSLNGRTTHTSAIY